MPNRENTFFQHVCEEAPIALITTDSSLIVNFWNWAAERLLGSTAEEMIGDHFANTLGELYREMFQEVLEETLETGRTDQYEMELFDVETNTPRVLLMTLSRLTDEQGEATGVSAWIVDETKARNTSRKLAEAQRMSALGTMAAGVAHHFNNILGGVATFADFAITSDDVGVMKRALHMSAEGATRASKLTNQLLSIANREEAEASLADMTEILLTFSHMNEEPLAKRGVALELTLGPVPSVEIDGARFHQVLQNLLSNAEEAMPNGGRITINISAEGSEAVVRFADTGCGMSEEVIQQAFEPFFTTKGVHSGGQDTAHAGLGLSVVHGVVTDAGGTISIDSQVGRGTTFVMRFPGTERD
jgi:two-component system cell cycle sensor histidine kinase/response regulator CckA